MVEHEVRIVAVNVRLIESYVYHVSVNAPTATFH